MNRRDDKELDVGYGCNGRGILHARVLRVIAGWPALLDSAAEVSLNFKRNIPTIFWSKFKQNKDLINQISEPQQAETRPDSPLGRDGESRRWPKPA
jgi:hypothetical protein